MEAAQNALNLAVLLLWLPLEILLIAGLLRGDWRRYPLLFLLVVTEFLMGVADAPRVLAVYQNVPDALRLRAGTYVVIELVDQVLLFAVVLGLISGAAAHLQSRNLIRAAGVLGAILFGAVTFWVHYNPHSKFVLAWMIPWTRDLNVCTTVLDLALWFLLLARREKDRRLFLLSGALGIEFSGSAIGNSLRSMATRQAPWLALAGGTVMVVANLVRIFIWARAFRPVAAEVRVKPVAPAGPPPRTRA